MAKNKSDYFSDSLPWVQNSQDEENPTPEAINESEIQKSVNTSESKIPKTVKRNTANTPEGKPTNTDKRKFINTPESILVNTSKSASGEVLKRQKVTYYINPAFAKKFKILAIERDLEMSELADEAVSDLLRKYGVI